MKEIFTGDPKQDYSKLVNFFWFEYVDKILKREESREKAIRELVKEAIYCCLQQEKQWLSQQEKQWLSQQEPSLI